MKLLRSFPLLIFLLMLVSITGYCLAQRSLVLLLVAGTLAVISWFVTEGPRGKTIPSWLSHVLVLAISLSVLLDWYQHQGDWMGVLGRYVVWLIVIKLYERKRPRDYGQLLAFSLLLMVTGSLLSADLAFSLVLLVYAILGLYVMLLHQLHGSFEREKEIRLSAVPRGYRLAPMFKPVIGQRVGIQFRIIATVVGLLGFILSMVLFLSFPRGRGEDAVPGLPSPIKRRTAFLNQVNLGAGSRITSSRRPVMRVELLDRSGNHVRDAPYLIRGGVLDEYLGDGKWRSSPADPVLIGVIQDEFSNLAEGVEDDSPYLLQHVKLDLALDVLPTLSSAYAIESSVSVEYDPVTQLIRKPEHVGRLMAYDVKSKVRPDAQTSLSLLHDRSLDWGPHRFQNPTVRDLSRRLLDSNGIEPRRPADPREAWRWNRRAANVFLRHLQSPEYEYTLDLSSVPAPAVDEDPILHFLVTTRKGHCEYFASALVAMCQSVGIQSRLITGFVAYEYEASTREYVISESNAHAWVEVRAGAAEWAVFDPTPPAIVTALHDIQPTLPDRVQRFMSRFESGFGNRFLEFNQQDQSQLAELMDMGWSDRLATIWEAVSSWAQRVNRSFKLGWAGYLWMGIVAFALVIAVVALIKLMRRSMQLRRRLRLQYIHGSEYQRMLRQLGFYLDMLYILAKGGHEKPSWQPPLQFAESLKATHPDAASHVQSLSNLFYAARYGHHALDRAEQREARTHLTELASLLRVKI